MEAVVLAAGQGLRLEEEDLKPLSKVLGLTLVERSILTLRDAGLEEIVLVSGFKGLVLSDFLAERHPQVKVIENEDWPGGSATSVLAARNHVGDRFLVVMCDHIFEPAVLRALLSVQGSFVAAVDSHPQYVDVAEATKVCVQQGRVVKIGKHLEDFNAVDAGALVCSRELFAITKTCLDRGKGEWNDIKREWVEVLHRDMKAYDLRGAFWLDVDTGEDLKRARKFLLGRLPRSRDGIVSRYLNRRLSCLLTGFLVETRLSPNQLSGLSFVLAVLSGALFFFGLYPLVALSGLVAQLASVIDGCDGEVARLKHMTSQYGGWFDAVLDRIGDAAIIFGMTHGLYVMTGQPQVWSLGFLALTASLVVSYMESRYESAFGSKMSLGRTAVPAKRDARLFVVMLGGLINQVGLALVALTLLASIEIARRLWIGYRRADV